MSTPRLVVSVAEMFKFLTVRAEFPEAYEAMRKLGVDKDGDVQERATDIIMRNLPDFMPRESGALIGGMWKRKPTRIHIDGPYARFLFHGVTAKGVPVDYSKQKNPRGGPNWDRRLAAERGKAIAAKLQQYAKKGRRR